MRRANGELFTLNLKGQEHLALWPSLESAARFKARNPELLAFVPAWVESAFGRNRLARMQKENMGLLLLTDTGGAHFRDARKMSWEEIRGRFPGTLTRLEPRI